MESRQQSSAEALGLIAALKRDFRRYFSPDLARNYLEGNDFSLFEKIRILLDSPGLHAVIVYRFGSWVHRRVRFALIRYPLLLLHYVLQKLCIICWGIYLHEGARIGPGLFIGHFGGVIVGPIQMGSDCNISQQVTIGVRADGQPGMPVLGDRVWIGVGSVIYGDVSIGDGVMIAPNTVVSRSLPPRSLVSGNPMRVISKEYDNTQAIYGRPAGTPASTPDPLGSE